jgi:hypothetical protein
MGSIAEGLSTEPEFDVNSQAGFEKLLEGKGVEKEEGDVSSADTSIASGLTTVEPDQAREPDGKFAPASTEDTSRTSAPDTSTAGAAASTGDPEVDAFLAKYGGDVDAAIKAAANQAAVLGRQGQELGKTREEIAELRGMVTALTATRAQEANVSPLAGLSDDQVEERASSLVENKGYAAAATEAANLAHTTGDERLYRDVFEAWQLEDPFTAVDFHSDFRNWQREQRAAAAAPEAAAEEPWVADAKQRALNNTIEQSFKTLAEERGGKEGFGPIAPFMDAALDQMPENVAAMIASNDPEARLSGLRIVADRATLLAGASVEQAPAAGSEGNQLPPEVQRKLSGSAVATGALKPPARRTDTPQTKEDAVKAFKKELMETETTSVASGLTYAK